MAKFKRVNIGNIPYSYYDIAVVDASGSLVFLSAVGYDSVINQMSKEIMKINNVFIEGASYTRTGSQNFEVEKRRQNNSDFSHMIAYKKDTVDEENGERLIAYVYSTGEEQKLQAVYDKIYKHTAVPILEEWMPYILNQMERNRYIRPCRMYYDEDAPAPFYVYNINMTKESLVQIVTDGLKNGSINIKGSNSTSEVMTDITGLDDYLNNFAENLAERIQESFVPKFIPGESLYDERLEDYDDSCYEEGIELYEAQRAVIQAAVNNLNKSNVTLVIGEMGSGKTAIGSGITYAHNKTGKGSTSIVMCPSHLTKKWKREVEKLVPNGKGYIIKDVTGLTKLDSKIRKENRKENMYIIMSKEAAKFGYDMRPAVLWSSSKKAFVCPECGNVLTKTITEGTGRYKRTVEVPFEPRDMIKEYAHNKVCSNQVNKWDKEENMWVQEQCGNKLWTPLNGDDTDIPWVKLGSEGWILTAHVEELFEELSNRNDLNRKDASFLMKLAEKRIEMQGDKFKNFSRAPRKYPLSKYIKKFYTGHIDYLLADELHQLKGETAQGQAFGDLTSAAKKTIGLTGTLLNGYADSLFYILYRTLSGHMVKEGFSYKDEASFMRTFGVIRKTQRFAMENGRAGTKLNSSEKRLPGVSPLVFTKFLLENAVFLSLSDMSEGLPSYEEIPIPIVMDDELKNAYDTLESNLKSSMTGRGGARMKAMGSLLQSLSVYPDMPYDQPPVIHPDSGQVLVVPQELPRGTRNKEAALLELVQRKIEAGEKTLVYYNWTKRTDLGEKLSTMFAENEIRAAVLENITPDKREEWIEQQVAEGIDVIICNPTLVETGLDLLDFTTIVFYQVGYNIFTMRQASRRSWRLSQEHPIEVYFMYYEGTIQEQALSLMATKLQASMAIEGKFSEEGLRAMSNNEDLLTQIANSVVNGIKHTVDATVFKVAATAAGEKERIHRVRRPKRDLIDDIEDVIDIVVNKPKVITLSYLLRAKTQTAPVTSTHDLMRQLFNKRQHIGNLF